MTHSQNKLFLALADRFEKLCQMSEDLFFKERPFIEHPKVLIHGSDVNGKKKDSWEDAPRTIFHCDVERKQIALEMEKVSEKMDKLVNSAKPVEDAVIEDLFGPITT